jgi:hypothetical protein
VATFKVEKTGVNKAAAYMLFNREKELVGKDFMLTEEQKKWVKDRIMIL